MKPIVCACALLLGSLSAPRALSAQPAQRASTREVRVEVVEVAGGQAYLEPGEAAGVRAGTEVLFGRRRFVVVTASASNAAVELGDRALERGAGGVARVRGRARRAPAERVRRPVSRRQPLRRVRGARAVRSP